MKPLVRFELRICGENASLEAVREGLTTLSVSSGAVAGSPKPGNYEKIKIWIKVLTLLWTFPALRKFGRYKLVWF